MKRKSFLEKINTIIWDWNGTIINDAPLCVDIMNTLLEKYKLPPIGLKTYRTLFNFPVKKYYEKLGFDFNKIPFEQVGQEFIDIYNQHRHEISLQPGAKQLLEKLHASGKKQILISARKHHSLLEDVKHFGLEKYFDHVIGINDDLAHGKAQLTEKFFKEQKINPEKTLFIGDTEHDIDIAQGLGAHFFTVSNGHNSAARLLMRTPFVYANLKTLEDFLFNA